MRAAEEPVTGHTDKCNITSHDESDGASSKQVKRQSVAEAIAGQSYWLSDEAICLFFIPKSTETAPKH